MALICSSKCFSFYRLYSCIFTGVVCAFSVCNEVPEEPVISPVSSHVFERRLILKFIQQNGTDPINGEPLTEDQLLEIKSELSYW